jgi:hypothetical protein
MADLLEQIIDKRTIYNGISGFLIWNSLAIIIAPWILLVLLSNNNQDFIENMAVSIAESMIDE